MKLSPLDPTKASNFDVVPEFLYSDLLPVADSEIVYRKLTEGYVSTFEANGLSFLNVEPEGLRLLTAEAMRDIAHLFRPEHLVQLAAILDDPEASDNDKFVAVELLKNANIAAGGVLPSCQDTGTAIIWGTKGERVITDVDDAEHISRGVYDT